MSAANDEQSNRINTPQEAFLRVKAEKVSQLLDLVGELGLAAVEVTRHPGLAKLELDGFEMAVRRLELLIREAQDLASSLRLVPVGEIFKQVQRVVRDLTHQTGKPIDLILEGGETEIDKLLVDQLHDPLLHLVRNAADPGLESPQDRQRAGKPERGRITVTAAQQGSEIHLTISDDGRGLNRDKILAKARQLGLIDAGAEPDDRLVSPGGGTAVDNLRHAANQMGYFHLVEILDGVIAGVAVPPDETQMVQLRQAELTLFEMLAAIEGARSQNLMDRAEDLAVPESELFVEHKPPAPANMPLSPEQQGRTEQTFDDLMSTIGELIATQASLHFTTDKLQAADLVETVTELLKQAGENQEQVQQQVQAALKPWLDNQRTLTQIETQLNTTLNRLHEMTLALRVSPAAEILDTLPLLAQEVAARQGKQVVVEITGAEIELDRGVLAWLRQTVQHLVSFVVSASLETPAQRQALAKSAGGRITVALSKHEDHLRLLIGDDGSGLDPAVALTRARELGWTTVAQAAGTDWERWVFKEGFRVNGSEQPDLAPLANELQARRGQLKLTSQTGVGLSFELYLPLDRVVMDSMVVRAGNVRYVVPINAICRIVKPEPSAIVHSSAGGNQNLLRLEEALFPIENLNGSGIQEMAADQLLLVVEKDHQPKALTIDELIGQQQVLVRPLDGFLNRIPYASGCAVLGEGDVGLVLSLH